MTKGWLGFGSLLYLYSAAASANLLNYFKEEDGSTKWQYVANFSSSILIITLSLVLIKLFISQRRLERVNRQLEQVRDGLEQRVRERTATLNGYNELLQETNSLLEGEIEQHRQTTTRLQSSEAYLYCIIESMPLVLIGLNRHNTISHWNRLAELASGVEREQALRHNLWEIYPAIPLSTTQLEAVLQRGKPETIKHCQRGHYYYDIMLFPLRQSEEEGVVILIDDVTQRKLSENRLIQRDKMASMGELASAMAHEMEVPLKEIVAAVKSATESLEGSGSHFEQTRQRLIEARERGEQAFTIMRNLLDFAREYGDNRHHIQMTALIDHTLELAASLIDEKSGVRFSDIETIRHYAVQLPTYPCYHSEMQYLFLTLFRHALCAIARVRREAFVPTLTVEVAFHYDALWLKIQHNGVGMSSDEQNTIFEPFYLDGESKLQDHSWQRLSLAYFIITEHHRGQIAVTSDINIGTTFHIELPLNSYHTH